MYEEHPIALKQPEKRKKSGSQTQDQICIVHFNRNKSDKIVRPLKASSWTKIKDVEHKRQLSNDPQKRLDDICKNIPNEHLAQHGYHRLCYQIFTNVKYLQKRTIQVAPDNNEEVGSKRQRTEIVATLFPSNMCILCGKEYKRLKGKSQTRENLTQCVTKTAEASIKEAAEAQGDQRLLREIQGVDLIAKEARYHNTCRRDYTRKTSRNPVRDETEEGVEQQRAHKKAFDFISEYIEQNIIRGSQVERMTMLCEKYLSFMQVHSPAYYNPQYKTCKLKSKLIKHFGQQISFWQPNFRSELVYSQEVPTGQAVEAAFESAASHKRRLEETGMMLRRHIKDSFKDSEELPWPPSASYLLSDNISLPDPLLTFLTSLISGKQSTAQLTVKKERLVNSIAQDICYAVSSGQWKMPKHLLLGMTVRHITGSAEIVSILNHFGHCISYSTLLELETAMCNHVTESDSLLPITIDKQSNVVTHFCWDNFDMNEETPSGAGTTHSTHGIVMQEVTGNNRTPTETTTQSKKCKKRSVEYKSQELEPCFAKKHVEPNVTVSKTSISIPEVVNQALISDFLWFFCRTLLVDGKQSVSGWTGWVSCTTTEVQTSHTTLDYMAPINSSVTENATVQHLLQISQKGTREVSQEHTIVTFDLAVAKKAYSLVWQNPQLYNDVIIRLGVFHTICSYLGAVGKLLQGTGFTEIIIESGICASGSVDKVLSGRHYNRAMRVHKLALEALERLLFESFKQNTISNTLIKEASEELKHLAKAPNPEGYQEILSEANSSHQLCEQYLNYKESVREGKLGKTAQFWILYMDKIWLVLNFLRATKENNLELHLSCLEQLCPLFFSMDHHNYARYISIQFISLVNLEHDHPGAERLLWNGAMSVCRSDVPGSRNPVDLTIEQTINRHAKCSGGIVGFSRNYPAYYRWCVTRHTRASYVTATLDMAGMVDTDECIHKETRPSEKNQSEQDVKKVVTAFKNFMNPFDIDLHDALFCLSSGAKAPSDVETDLLNVDKRGSSAFKEFVQKRLVDKSISFHSPLKKQKTKTFAKIQVKKKVTSKQNKMIQITAQRNLFGQLLMLSEQAKISMERALSYPLSPLPWALATADGLPTKTDKSTLLHKLEDDTALTSLETQEDKVYIIDGNALLQSLTNLPHNFGELAEQVFNALPKVKRVDFVTDRYMENSIKSAERMRRGTSESFLVKGPSTKIPRDWKSFLMNSTNKEHLIRLLLKEWKKEKYAPKLVGRQLFFACEEVCVLLTSGDGQFVQSHHVEELASSQEEADTRMILHCMHVAQFTSTPNIIVRSPDTDVFMLLLYYCDQIRTNILFDTGVADKRRLINIKTLSQFMVQICAKHYLAYMHSLDAIPQAPLSERVKYGLTAF